MWEGDSSWDKGEIIVTSSSVRRVFIQMYSSVISYGINLTKCVLKGYLEWPVQNELWSQPGYALVKSFQHALTDYKRVILILGKLNRFSNIVCLIWQDKEWWLLLPFAHLQDSNNESLLNISIICAIEKISEASHSVGLSTSLSSVGRIITFLDVCVFMKHHSPLIPLCVSRESRCRQWVSAHTILITRVYLVYSIYNHPRNICYSPAL